MDGGSGYRGQTLPIGKRCTTVHHRAPSVGITQVELVVRIGRPQTFVSMFETEEPRRGVAECVAVAKAAGVGS